MVRARLVLVERQRIGRDVIGLESERVMQRVTPRCECLPGHVIEQVDGDTVHARRTSLGHRYGNVAKGVAPAKAPQLGRVGALRADRDAIDAGRGETLQVAAISRAWVHLERDLAVDGYAERFVGGGQHSGDVGGVHERGGAAADVDATQWIDMAVEARRAPAQLDLSDERVDEGSNTVLRPAGGAPGIHDKVAVGTDADAEREVDVQRSWRQRSAQRAWFSPTTSHPCGPILLSCSATSSSNAADGVTWPACPVAMKTAKRVTACARRIAPMPPVTTVTQPPTTPMPSDRSSNALGLPGAPSLVASV